MGKHYAQLSLDDPIEISRLRSPGYLGKQIRRSEEPSHSGSMIRD